MNDRAWRLSPVAPRLREGRLERTDSARSASVSGTRLRAHNRRRGCTVGSGFIEQLSDFGASAAAMKRLIE
jgi:hypothetical protein